MQIHVKKSSFIALILGLLPLQLSVAQWNSGNSAAGGGQGASAAGPNGGNTAPPPSPAPAPSASGLDGATDSALRNFFTSKPQQGTGADATAHVLNALGDKIKAMDALKTTAGMDDPIIKEHFVTYLSLKPVPQDRIDKYNNEFTEITNLLKTGGQDNVVQAYKDLYVLSSDEDLDAGISSELAHQIESIWGVDRTNNDLDKKDADLRHEVDTETHNSDLDAEDLKRQEYMDQAAKQNMANSGKGAGSRNGGGSSSGSSGTNSSSSSAPTSIPDPSDSLTAAAALAPTMGESLQGKMTLFDDLEKNASARAKIFLNERRKDLENDAVRTNFASYIKTLYDDHRYYQVIMAAAFYQNFFPDGDVPQDVGNQVASAAGTHGNTLASGLQPMGKKLGLGSQMPNFQQYGGALGIKTQPDAPLTIPEMVTAALEANSRVADDVQVFQHKQQNGEVAAAATELQQAFVDNEFHPDLKVLPQDAKEKVGDFIDQLSKLRNQLENRAYQSVDAQVAAIKKIASDFDDTEPTTMAHTAQLESMMLLGKAKMMAQQGNDKGVEDAMTDAIAVWPGNPELYNSGIKYFQANDVGNEMTGEFDRDVQDQNYRAIFDKEPVFAPAVINDPTRKQQLEDAVKKVAQAKAAAEKADYMAKNGDMDGAWETIDKAVTEWPNDMELNRLMSEYSAKSADFVSALENGREAEAKKELGYSLTWYVNAQSRYPASEIANDGIARISKQILSPQADPAPAAAVSPSAPQAN